MGRPLAHQPQWRQDFPIDWPQDEYVARRDFSKFLVLTSVAFVVGQVWIAAQNLVRANRPAAAARARIARAATIAGGRRRDHVHATRARTTLPADPTRRADASSRTARSARTCRARSCPRVDGGRPALPVPRGLLRSPHGPQHRRPAAAPAAPDRARDATATTSTPPASRRGRSDDDACDVLSRARSGLTIVYGILCFVLMLVVLQLWLLTATMNAFLGGDERSSGRRSAPASRLSRAEPGLLRYLRTDRAPTTTAPADAGSRDAAPGVLRAGHGDRHRLDRRAAARPVALVAIALFALNIVVVRRAVGADPRARRRAIRARASPTSSHHGRGVGFFTDRRRRRASSDRSSWSSAELVGVAFALWIAGIVLWARAHLRRLHRR